MLDKLRGGMGKVVWGILASILAVVFVIYGLFDPNQGNGNGGSGAFAGSVNGDVISLAEFRREMERRTEYMKQLFGGSVSEEQLKAFRIHEAVFQDLVSRKLMIARAEKEGMLPADQAIRDQALKVPAFQKDGKFDKVLYKQVLEANRYTPAAFEKMIRDDLILEKWRNYFAGFARVSATEIKKELTEANTKRSLRYVLVSRDAISKTIPVSDSEIDAFLKEETKKNIAKSRYDSEKELKYKDKTFDQVSRELAKEILAGEKSEIAKKKVEELADALVPALSDLKGGEAKAKKLLEGTGMTVQNLTKQTQKQIQIPGFFDLKSLHLALFGPVSEKNPGMDGTAGQSARKFTSPSGTLVAIVTDKEDANLSAIKDQDRAKALAQLAQQKQSAIFDRWLKGMSEKAKIDRNAKLLDSEVPGGNE